MILNRFSSQQFSQFKQLKLDYKMISQLRKIVAGPKKRTVTQEFDLDFTYITSTVAAMAFPASGIEQTYRNSIYDVAKFLETEHKSNYLIINVSNRKYDYKIFENKVKQYEWKDHQAPTLDVLFQVSFDAFSFLKQTNGTGIVCYHCNHGKGRTGTAIICLLLFSGLFTNVQEALKFYNGKRFAVDNYGVSQPCQVRYLQYFLAALNYVKSQKYLNSSIAYKLVKIEHEGLIQHEYEISLYLTRDQSLKYNKIQADKNIINIQQGEPMMNDVYIQIVKLSWTGNQVVARANINLNFFMEEVNQKQVKWIMDGKKVRLSNSHTKNFKAHFYFQRFCECHIKLPNTCLCWEQRKFQQEKWQKTIKYIKFTQSISKSDRESLLFSPQAEEENTVTKTLSTGAVKSLSLDGIKFEQKPEKSK